MISVLLIRHGATLGNLEKKYIGKTDEELCEEGLLQAMRLKEQCFQPDYLFVSPLKRARQTAEIAFSGKNYTVVEELSETDFGFFEGKTASQLCDNQEYRKWLDSFCLAPIPGGESVSDFKQRCCSSFLSILQTIPDGSKTAFIVHGGVIMAIMEAYLEPKGNFYDYRIGNGQYLQVGFEKNTSGHTIRLFFTDCTTPVDN